MACLVSVICRSEEPWYKSSGEPKWIWARGCESVEFGHWKQASTAQLVGSSDGFGV